MEDKPQKPVSTFHAFQMKGSDPTMPRITENRTGNWVNYGVDNLYPNTVITPLYNTSAINRSCLDSKIVALFGEGLATVNPESLDILKTINPEEGWNEVFLKAATDYEIYGGFALNIIWAKDRKTIAEIWNMDFNDIRSGMIDPETDKVEFYYYSADWSKSKKDIYKPKAFKAFSQEHAGEYPNQILYFFKYNPGQKYYPMCSYSGSLVDIQVDVSVSSFHYWNLKQGLSPSLFISMNDGIPPPEKRQEIYNDLEDSFSGIDKAGKFFLSFSVDKEHAPEVTPIESANSDYYVVLDSRITSRILTGHRITSPLLLGIKDGGNGLSSNKDEILVAYSHFVNTVIQPDQKILLKQFNKLLDFYGFPGQELYLVPKRLFNEDGEQVGTAQVKEIE